MFFLKCCFIVFIKKVVFIKMLLLLRIILHFADSKLRSCLQPRATTLFSMMMMMILTWCKKRRKVKQDQMKLMSLQKSYKQIKNMHHLHTRDRINQLHRHDHLVHPFNWRDRCCIQCHLTIDQNHSTGEIIVSLSCKCSTRNNWTHALFVYIGCPLDANWSFYRVGICFMKSVLSIGSKTKKNAQIAMSVLIKNLIN